MSTLSLMADDVAAPAATVFAQGLCALPHWGVIRASGADAATFLQSQLTQDVSGMAIGRDARLAGFCSAKGRLLASFVVWREAADEFRLACSADVLPAVLKRLSMFVLRAKCKLSDAGGSPALHGVVAGATDDDGGLTWPSATWRCEGPLLRLSDALGCRRALWIGADAPAATLPRLADASAWDWLEVHSAVPRIVAATVEQFVPQMINFEVVGGVNFQKGCYPGQEVVARSQYRGTVKRRAWLFDSAASAPPGQEIFAADDPGQPCGMVVNAASLEGQHAVLAEVKLAALGGAALHLGAADGPPLARIALPYALPSLE